MTYKTIVACLNEALETPGLLQYARDFAAKFEAHLTGLYVVPAVRIYPMASFEPLPEMFEATRQYFLQRAGSTKEAFAAAIARSGAKVDFKLVESASPIVADASIEHGRTADLVIAGHVDRSHGAGVEIDFVERLVMGVGRPVIVVPLKWASPLRLDRIIVGWGGQREAARAVFDCLPLLKQSRATQLLSIGPESPGQDGLLRAVTESLRRHGVESSCERLPIGETDAASTLLKEASARAADLLVLGAYGHSRLHEFILGGVTRSALAHMPCPILFSH